MPDTTNLAGTLVPDGQTGWKVSPPPGDPAELTPALACWLGNGRRPMVGDPVQATRDRRSGHVTAIRLAVDGNWPMVEIQWSDN